MGGLLTSLFPHACAHSETSAWGSASCVPVQAAVLTISMALTNSSVYANPSAPLHRFMKCTASCQKLDVPQAHHRWQTHGAAAPRGCVNECCQSSCVLVYPKGSSAADVGSDQRMWCVTRTERARQVAPRATTRGTAHPRNQCRFGCVASTMHVRQLAAISRAQPSVHTRDRLPYTTRHARMCRPATRLAL